MVVEVGLAASGCSRSAAPRAPRSHRGVGRALPVVAEVGVEVDVLHRLACRARPSRPAPLGCGGSVASAAAAASALPASSSRSSSTGFSTSSWVSSVSSSIRVICSSLIACCSDGVITSFWDSLSDSFCSRAMVGAVYRRELFAEVDLAHLRVVGELGGVAGAQDLAVVDDIGPVRDLQCFPHVVVGDQDADAHRLQVPMMPWMSSDRDRVDPRERLVEEDIPGADHQRARDLDPPALAAGERVALVRAHRARGRSPGSAGRCAAPARRATGRGSRRSRAGCPRPTSCGRPRAPAAGS